MKRKQEEEDRKTRAEEEKAMQVGCYSLSLKLSRGPDSLPSSVRWRASGELRGA